MGNGDTQLLTISSISGHRIMKTRHGKGRFGMTSVAQTLNGTTGRPGRLAPGHCTLPSAVTTTRHGCHCWKRPMQKRMVIIQVSRAGLSGECGSFYVRQSAVWQLLNSTTREAIEDLTGGVTSEIMSRDILDKERFWNEDLMNVNKKFVFGCATGLYGRWLYPHYYASKERSGIHECHAYSVMDAKEINGQRLLRLRYV